MNNPTTRSDRLLDLLQSDPDNLRLLGDAADTAFAEGRPELAVELIDRYAGIAPPPPGLINILGLVALEQGRYGDAASVFQSLHDSQADDAGLRFNLAWARSRLGEFEAVLDLVSEDLAMARSVAALLKIQALHHLGRLDEALALGERVTEPHGDAADLMGALASVAIDAEDVERARFWAQRSAGAPEGQATLGMLALAEGRMDEASQAFSAGLAVRSDSARNLLGMGLVQMRRGDMAAGAAALDQAAEVFVDHSGTWIAAGWAYFLAGDAARAMTAFERARDVDPAFGEAHGAIAVVQLLQGDVEDARRHAATARRLDKETLGGALADLLLAQSEGRTELADRIREAALTMPVGPGGQTVAEALAQVATRPSASRTSERPISD
ncbi:tetratricopeptide repeat protein [Brevundimonas faecalis]|uniref:Tetratricopeptide (TPR) repeat protein n=1 Tax=Brevundimonas faecalis TaxID=947378 RepID=A0ABV2R7I5_9CAUL